MEMLVSAAANAPVKDLAQGLVAADEALNHGANKQIIKNVFKDRGLPLD